MLRYVMKCHRRDCMSGYERHELFTVDGDAAAVEAYLRRGGHGPDGYEHFTLEGVEVLDTAPRAQGTE